MNEHEQNNQIRAHADGELARGDADAFERRVGADPVLAGRVEAERQLRAAVGRVMTETTPGAPAELVERVRDTLAEETMDATPSWWAGPTRAKPYAVAASLALVCGAILFGIFGRQIDSIRATSVDPATMTTEFVSGEHRRCSGEVQHRDVKATWRAQDTAARELDAHMGVPVPVIDLSHLGYTFFGAGRCKVPGDDRSCHLLYVTEAAGTDGCPKAMVSLFVVRDTGQLQGLLRPEKSWVPVRQDPGCGGSIACGSDGALLYLLVCCNSTDMLQIAKAISRRSQS